MVDVGIIVSRRKLEEFIHTEKFDDELGMNHVNAKVDLHITDLTFEDFEDDFKRNQYSAKRAQYLKDAYLGGPVEDEYDKKLVEERLATNSLESLLEQQDKMIKWHTYDSIEDMINRQGYYKVIDGKIYTDHNDKGIFDSIIYVDYGPFATEEENEERNNLGISWTDYTQYGWYLKGKNGEHAGCIKMSEWNGKYGEYDEVPAFIFDADNNKTYVHERWALASIDELEKVIDDGIKDLGEEDRYVYLFHFHW